MNCKQGNDRQELALQVIAHSRRVITRQAPILLGAVYALREKKRDTPGPISTDGTYLWYDPEQVIADFRQDRDSVAEQILHVTLHCLLGHLSVRENYANSDLFDVIADCKTAMFASALGCRLANTWEFSVPSQVENGPGGLPALYRWLEPKGRTRRSLIREVSGSHIRMDDHRLWRPKVIPAVAVPANGQGMSEGKPDWERIRGEICEQASATQQWGHLPGRLKEDCRMAEENEISYTQFLRRFAAPRERIFCDPDSIDSRWYHVGMEQYGNIPLLEPCELSEPMVGDDLVIAMDTSGSCSGEICSRFLRETCNLLRDISAGSSAFRVLLLQCDCEIQKEMMVRSNDDLERLPETFKPEGFGGTDFCPVFRRVEELREEGALPNVRGLIYLSDGYGDFPDRQPDYPVVFILADEDENTADDLPNWVTGLKLNEHDFTLQEVS